MPIYEYKCKDCDKQFETLVLNPKDTVTCDTCNGSDLEKQFSPFGIKSEAAQDTSDSPGAGCGCTPVSCGCSVGH